MQPIFIVGCQRSGSTMLGALLGGAAEAIAIPEAQFVAELAPDSADAPVDPARVIDAIAEHYRFRIWNFDLEGARPDPGGSYADTIRWLVARYAAAQGREGVTRWIDHQPGHVREMAVLRSHFPALKAVHVVRDGRAVAASIMPLNWGPNAVHSAANFWAQRVAMGSALRSYLGEDAWMEVRYEDIVTDPEPVLRRIAAFLGLGYDAAMSEGGRFAVPAFTQNQHALVGKRPDPSRLDSWRKTLSPRDIEMFEALVGPLLTYHGYRRDFPHARLPGFAEKVGMTINDQWQAMRKRRRFEARVREFGG